MPYKQKILISTVGLPRCGKSTWVKSQGVPVVNPDSIRLALHGQRYVAAAEAFVWATAEVMVKALFLAGHDTVILDATNTNRKRRDAWRSPDWINMYVCFDTPIDVCIQRAIDTDQPDLVPVIEAMNANFEPVVMAEEGYAGPVSDSIFSPAGREVTVNDLRQLQATSDSGLLCQG